MSNFSDVAFVVQDDIDVFVVYMLSALAANIPRFQIFGDGDGFITLRVFHEYLAHNLRLGFVYNVFFVLDNISVRRMAARGVAFEPAFPQAAVDALTEKGFGKTADEAYSLMNCVFKGAIAHNIISRNPISTVIHVQHERENGIALSLEQEAMLVKSSSPYRLYFLIALYTGMCPNKYSTLRREGDMLIVKNSKRKGNKIEYKRIPICHMLRPYIGDLTEIVFPTLQTLYKNLRKELGCCLYDLRTTFNTRCVECHVDENARKIMMGHSLGKLADAYTHVSDGFLKKEAQKLCYTLPL